MDGLVRHALINNGFIAPFAVHMLNMVLHHAQAAEVLYVNGCLYQVGVLYDLPHFCFR